MNVEDLEVGSMYKYKNDVYKDVETLDIYLGEDPPDDFERKLYKFLQIWSANPDEGEPLIWYFIEDEIKDYSPI